MICEECQGRGFVYVKQVAYVKESPCKIMAPCQLCQGCGIAYCCDEAGANPPNTFEDINEPDQGSANR